MDIHSFYEYVALKCVHVIFLQMGERWKSYGFNEENEVNVRKINILIPLA